MLVKNGYWCVKGDDYVGVYCKANPDGNSETCTDNPSAYKNQHTPTHADTRDQTQEFSSTRSFAHLQDHPHHVHCAIMKIKLWIPLSMFVICACETTHAERQTEEFRETLWENNRWSKCSIHGDLISDPATGATSCACEAGWSGEYCEVCERSNCPSLTVRGIVTFGEEKGESRIASGKSLKPDGATFSKGDVVVTKHTIKVLEVRRGQESLKGTEITIWVQGGEVPLAGQPNKFLAVTYFGGGYLVEDEYYELDLAPLMDAAGRPSGYYIPNAHAGMKMLSPPAGQGGSPAVETGDNGQYLNSEELPEICQDLDEFSGFDSFDEAIDFAHVFGRLEDASLYHTTVPDKFGSVLCSGSGEKFYDLDKPFVSDFSVANYEGPYWTASQAEACADKMFESVHEEFTSTGNSYSRCICPSDSGCANVARPRILVAGCSGPNCDPWVDSCDAWDNDDESNCIAVQGVGGLGGQAPGVTVAQTVSVLVLPETGDYGVKVIEGVDISFSPHANFSFFDYGGLDCTVGMNTPDVDDALELEPVEFTDVFVHEMGHAMGLKHVSNPGAMMYGSIVDIPDPQVMCHDRARLGVLYPRASCSDDGHGWPCSCGYAEDVAIAGVECLPGD